MSGTTVVNVQYDILSAKQVNLAIHCKSRNDQKVGGCNRYKVSHTNKDRLYREEIFLVLYCTTTLPSPCMCLDTQ